MVGLTTRASLAAMLALALLATLPVPSAPGGGGPAAAPDSHGPFPVGFYNTTVPNAGPAGAPAPATVFYPATAEGTDTTSDTSLAPYGTVSFAPGYGASRIDYWEMLHHLAALGYVVLGTDYDPSAFPNTADMAFRVGYSLDYLESENASAPSRLYTMVDGSRLVSAGHSMGGGVSVLAAAQHPRFDAVMALSPYILAPLFWPPDMPGSAVTSVFLPMQIIVGSADTTAPPGFHSDILYANGNCPKSEYTITGADHTFSDPADRQLVAKYADLWLHYYLERDGAVFDGLFGAGAQADVAAGLITYQYCLDVASLTLTPDSATVLVGNSLAFNATVRDRVGTAWNAPVAWSAAGGIGSVDATGLFTATAAGVGNVTASVGGLTDASLVTTGPDFAPRMRRATLVGAALADLRVEWWKSADDGAPNGPVSYRLLYAFGDPLGPYSLLSSVTADGSPSYSGTCAGCGHMPGDTARIFFRVESVDLLGNVRESNLAARYARPVSAGWNLLSLPLEQADSTVTAVLQTVSHRTVRTHSAADGADPWKATYVARAGDLTAVSFGSAFWVEIAVDGQYTLAGIVVDAPALALSPGWNLVAYVAVTSTPAGVSLAGLPVTSLETFQAGSDLYQLRRVAFAEILSWGDACWVLASASTTWVQG